MLKERDSRIHGLEERLRRNLAAESAFALEQSRRQQELEDSELEAQVDVACQKSEALLSKISGLGTVEEPELQWSSLMAANEDCRDRLAQIEAIVQRRVEQLPPGDAELRVCQAVRGLCIGVQRAPPRRWTLGVPFTPSSAGPPPC